MNVEEKAKTLAEEIAANMLGEKVEILDDLLNKQEEMLCSEYQIGVYNGLVLAKSILTGEQPKFKEGGRKDERSN